MTDSFVLVASVLAALAIGMAIAATAWWMSARVRSTAATTPGAAIVGGTRAPATLIVIAAGLLASVGVLYMLSTGSTPGKTSNSAVAGVGATPAVNALAASMSLGNTSLASVAPSSAASGTPKGGDLDVMTERLAKRLRERTPDDHESWALLARSYVELGRDADAVAAYERAGPLLKSDAGLRAELDAVKARVAAPAAKTAVADNAKPGTDIAVLSGTVDVSPALKAKLPKSGFIFVIARMDGQAGAPLAAKRIPMAALPMSFALTDADSMLPGQKLSGVKTVSLSARVSETGDAAPSSGALESKKEPVAVGRKDIALVLTTQRE